LSSFNIEGGFGNLLIVSIVFGLVNAFIRPIVKLLTLPINVITLGLFTIVINMFMLYITSWIIGKDMSTGGLLNTLLASIIISIVSTLLSWILKDD
jgi:putative membrane protein